MTLQQHARIAALTPPFGSAEVPAAKTTDPLLRISGAGKTYRQVNGTETVALMPATVDIRRGEFVSLVGPSGCGKTTLLKICAGLVKQSTGIATFADTGRPMQPGAYGFVFQSPALLPWRSVLDNVMLPADILGLDRKAALKRAGDLLQLVRLKHCRDKRPTELSGGMRQRVSIARALLHDPEMLLMDEPFGALDAMTREELNMELQRIHIDQQKTVLFVTHDIEESVLLSDRILVMSCGPGRLVADISVRLKRPRDLTDKRHPNFYETVENVRGLLERQS